MSQEKNKIELIISILYELENELENIKMYALETKQKLILLIQEEINKTHNQVIKDITSSIEKELDLIKLNTRKDAIKIINKNEEKIINIKSKMDKVYDEAVKLVINTVLGEDI